MKVKHKKENVNYAVKYLQASSIHKGFLEWEKIVANKDDKNIKYFKPYYWIEGKGAL